MYYQKPYLDPKIFGFDEYDNPEGRILLYKITVRPPLDTVLTYQGSDVEHYCRGNVTTIVTFASSMKKVKPIIRTPTKEEREMCYGCSERTCH